MFTCAWCLWLKNILAYLQISHHLWRKVMNDIFGIYLFGPYGIETPYETDVRIDHEVVDQCLMDWHNSYGPEWNIWMSPHDIDSTFYWEINFKIMNSSFIFWCLSEEGHSIVSISHEYLRRIPQTQLDYWQGHQIITTFWQHTPQVIMSSREKKVSSRSVSARSGSLFHRRYM